MTHPSKQKGNRFEREVVKLAQENGLTSKRAWGSNGMAMGMPEEVDVLIEDLKFQCKSRKKLPKVFMIPECCDAVLLKENNIPPLVVIPLKVYLNMLEILVHKNNISLPLLDDKNINKILKDK